ncbi:MAG TPA: glycosyltransferase family 9 protein [Steroidobacteraceae bacterium]|nr:glycosyltransferase family 9 protein [Steroidobacteraceae bacterium]
MPSLNSTPQNICILRLSAIGDTCHVVAVLRTLQQAWPGARFTWVIGALESTLLGAIPEVEFITVAKRASRAQRTELIRTLRSRRFDVLLHMQLALRASLIARHIRAPIKLGFDWRRARELQWLFTNQRIAARTREHVLDGFFGFAAALGVPQRLLRWEPPIPQSARDAAVNVIPDGVRTLIISPCSSHRRRNWSAERYAAVADYAARVHGMQVLLCGAPSGSEREMGAAIMRQARGPLRNRVGEDTLPQLLALLARATVLLSPDSGPVHMATMVGTPVIGLYAATNPARSGPYLSREWCVNAYPQAAERFRGRPAEELPWTTKIEVPGVMDLIEVPQVTAKLDALLGSAP